MKQLVTSWLQAERTVHNHSTADAIRLLNEAFSTHITHSRVAEWRRGVYTPSHGVLAFMLHRTLPWALQRAGIDVSAEQIAAIEPLLWDTGVDDGGERYIDFLDVH